MRSARNTQVITRDAIIGSCHRGLRRRVVGLAHTGIGDTQGSRCDLTIAARDRIGGQVVVTHICAAERDTADGIALVGGNGGIFVDKSTAATDGEDVAHGR